MTITSANSSTDRFTTPSLTQPQPWHRALSEPAKEFSATPLKVLSGKIPFNLQGTFYQNGTGRLQRGGQSVGHWFDGDGAILRVGLGEGHAIGTYRYVQTQGYQAEGKGNRFLYGNYGRRYPGPIWRHVKGLFTASSVKNAANTAVLALPDKLLALWEAGNPHSLDLVTLETKGIDTLGWLKTTQQFSAHPLQDPLSEEIYSIGVTPLCELMIYRCDRACRLIKQRNISLKTVPIVHSFVIAGPYLVFLISPVAVDMLSLLLNQQPFSEAARWKGDRGTRILVIDRETLETVSDSQADAWFQWHYGNGCIESDGSLRLDFAKFDDFLAINAVLGEVPTGKITTKAYGRLWQLKLNPKTGKILSNDCVLDQDCEFPQVPAAQTGQPWQHTYVLMHRDGISTGEDWFGAIGRFDYDAGTLIKTDLGENCYGSEPIHAPGEDGSSWLLVVIYNAADERSELWILNAATLGEPVCRLALPQIIPLGFHGTWKPS